MYVSLSRLRVKEHGTPRLTAAFRARADLVDDADGFIDLQVWQSDRDAGELVMVSRWRDRAVGPPPVIVVPSAAPAFQAKRDRCHDARRAINTFVRDSKRHTNSRSC